MKWCRILISSRNGMLSFYALILMVILGFLLSGLQTAAVDHNLNCRLALFESQARQGADSGLNICLRVANDDHPVDGIISSITSQTGAVASMTIWLHRSGCAGSYHDGAHFPSKFYRDGVRAWAGWTGTGGSS